MTNPEVPDQIERRLVVGSSVLGSVFSLVGVASNASLGGTGVLVWGCAVSSLGFAVLVLLARRDSVSTSRLAVGFLAVAGFLVASTWEANGGVRGSTTPAVAALIVFAVLALPSRFAIIGMLGALGFFLAMSMLELWDGEPAALPFQGMDEAIDSLITTLSVSVICGMGVVLMRRTYDRNLGRLREANARIEELAARAVAADREKTRFLARMSHDLRTPLAAVVGGLEVAAREDIRPEVSALLAGARERCHDLERIIADLLHVGLLEAGEMSRVDADVALGSLVRHLASCESPRPGVAFRVDVDGGLPEWVRLDATRVSQAVGNLLGNAIKHTDAGEIVLSVSAAGGMLRFAVADTGPGIAAADIRRVFDPYVQLDRGRTRGGAGLGLFIVGRIADHLGGRVTLDSSVGRGTCAALEIPLVAAEPPSPGAQAADDGRRVNVLVADDEPVLRLALEAMLQSLGYEVDVVADGLAALERARAGGIDVVILDVNMPVMDGLEACRRIREACPALPVIALTANAYPEDVQRALSAGMQAFLTKPVTLQQLREAIDAAVVRAALPAGSPRGRPVV